MNTEPLIPTEGVDDQPQVDDRARAAELAERYHCDLVDLRDMHLDVELLRSTPVDLMFRYNFVPLGAEADALVIAMADPSDLVEVDEVSALLDRPLVIKVAAQSEISDLLKKSESSQRVLDEATEGFKLDLIREDDSGGEIITIETITQDESSPIIRLVDTIVFTALGRRASDIHIETGPTELVVKYRVDGMLSMAMDPIAKEHHSTIISRIKVMSELDISEKRIPQDGRFKTRYKGRSIDFRVSIMPSIHGEDAVIRILDKESISEEFRTLNLDVVGFSAADSQRFHRFINEPYGMVLVTGPTGSGKTTTLYAALMEIKNDEDKIITIEDPVEYELQGINQIPVNAKRGLTFASGLRSILRQDPDIVLVGEIRDGETADIAIRSALTGHLILSTLHTNDAISSIGRLVDMGAEPYLVASVLEGLLAQRLGKRICEFCRTQIPMPEDIAARIRPKELEKFDGKTWIGSGCEKCSGSGYRGRVGFFELLRLRGDLRNAIADEAGSAAINQSLPEDFHTMREDGMSRAIEGVTTVPEVLRATQDAEEVYE